MLPNEEGWYFRGVELGLRTARVIAERNPLTAPVTLADIDAQIARVVRRLKGEYPRAFGDIEYASWLTTAGDIEVASWLAEAAGLR